MSKTPNELGIYDCTCPDRWMAQTCKHRFGAALLQEALTLAHRHRLDLPAYRRTLRTLPSPQPFGSHEHAALQVLLNATESYDARAQEAARQHHSTTHSYAAVCFTAMRDKARWAYGAGYVGWADERNGDLHSVMAGRPVIPLRWDEHELRWYVVGEEGCEDSAATTFLLSATCSWWERLPETEEECSPTTTFEAEEAPDGHGALRRQPTHAHH